MAKSWRCLSNNGGGAGTGSGGVFCEWISNSYQDYPGRAIYIVPELSCHPI